MRTLSRMLLVASLAACDLVVRDAPKQDTTVIGAGDETALGGDTALARRAPLDSGVPMADTIRGITAPFDSGVVTLLPARPRRGGVLIAFAPGVASEVPRCAWRGAPIPCYSADGGIRVIVPLPADEQAGRAMLMIDRPRGRITREIDIAEGEFGRELILLPPELYRLVSRDREIARDARALQQILSTETSEQRWEGRWRLPVEGGRTAGYGTERFYFPRGDSTRTITLGAALRSRGSFGADTSMPGASDVPSWRHAGVDITVRQGTPVTAPAAGMISHVGEYILTGRTLLMDHGHGVHSAYFHLDTVLVRAGERVPVGARLARVGSTGLATGPHLHYGIYIHGRDVDPAAWRDLTPFARSLGVTR